MTAAPAEVLHAAGFTAPRAPAPAPAARYGPYDAVCVLMAAGRKVAWRWRGRGRDGSYYVDGQQVTVGQLNRLAGEIAARPFALSALPVFKEDQ